MRFWATLCTSFALACILVAPCAGAATLCATTNPLDTDCGDGACWLESALAVAATNNQDDVIRLVQGTHVADDFDGFDYDSSQGNDITISGGWNGTCTAQTIDPNNTVIEGIIDGTRLVVHNQQGGNIVIEGVTVQNGNWWNLFGLDVLTKVTAVGQDADVTISDCMVQDNAGDGGISVHTVAYTAGGFTPGSILIEGCIIRDNAGSGVVVSSRSLDGSTGTVDIVNNTITGNSDTYVQTITTSGTAEVITIAGNLVAGNGPSVTGGGLEVKIRPGAGTAESIVIRHNEILDNATNGSGGGLSIEAPASDTAGLSGGTVYLVNNVISGNTAGGHGGGIDLLTTSAAVAGDEGARYVVNNTITGNEGANWTETHGLLIHGRADTVVRAYNNIIWGNSPGVSGYDLRMWCDASAETYIYNNDYESIFTQGTIYQGANINQDPEFVDPLTNDFHLTAPSDCIDTGLNNAPVAPDFDIDGQARPLDGDGNGTEIIDMGADEFSPIGDLIFADGFETGDTSRWTDAVP